MRMTIVAGARPNFMKIAPIIEAIEAKQRAGYDLNYRLVHTGQHYDENLSDAFFSDLGIPPPDVNLDVQSGSQAEQTAAIMMGFEKDLRDHPSDLVMVVGDVNSTLACAIVAKKAGVKVAHIEAGIRSGDMNMPEEVNRIVTDSLTDYFFTTSEHANTNLMNNGVDKEQIFFVGNVMIDTLLKNRSRFIKPRLWDEIGLTSKKYLVMTLHRPSNVDDPRHLNILLKNICSQIRETQIVFPVHPRTNNILRTLGSLPENLILTEPFGYLEFNYLIENALGVLTDSGGITEETTVMNVPCITLRENTERPETCDIGTNILVGNDLDKLNNALSDMMAGNWKSGDIPELWDGSAAIRIVERLIDVYAL